MGRTIALNQKNRAWKAYGSWLGEYNKEAQQPRRHRELAANLPYEMQTNATLQQILVHTDSLVKTIDILRSNLKELRRPTADYVQPKPSYTLMTVKEYANHIGKAPSTIYGQIRSGKLEAIQEKPGHAIRIKVYEKDSE